MRGEQTFRLRPSARPWGSPPLARGTAVLLGHDIDIVGITPACAGNSHRPCRNRSHRRDHPRLRGEQAAWQMQPGGLVGSPPLARGTGTGTNGPLGVFGITPACAGNSKPCCGNTKAGGDHPRLRGEQSPGGYITYPGEGSPPLARGTVLRALPQFRLSRITPACAGNSVVITNINGGFWDHPRLRGEQGLPAMPCDKQVGSPPLARGTGRSGSPQCACTGITPACAGNSGRDMPQGGRGGDHPRLRGEQAEMISARTAITGSPPLARGTVWQPLH